MHCCIQWTTCADVSTAHDPKHPVEAIAYAVLSVGSHIKAYPICSSHMGTLLKRVMHHDLHCTHPSTSSEHWTICDLKDIQ